jgi:hypothetical protein
MVEAQTTIIDWNAGASLRHAQPGIGGRKMLRTILWSSLSAILLGLVILTTGCTTTTTPSGSVPAAASTAGNGSIASDTVIGGAHANMTLKQLVDIQPGLGTVMIEYNARMNNLWFAAQKLNWDMVHYQIFEMKEIQETGESTRPGRDSALKAFESAFLEPMDHAAQAKDLTVFTKSYDSAIAGCNGCHAASSSSQFKSYKFVKIIRPTASNFNNVDWAGQ